MEERASIHKNLAKLLKEELFLNSESYKFSELDSLSIINLIVALEKNFQITIEMSDLQENIVGDFDKLLKYLQDKKQKN